MRRIGTAPAGREPLWGVAATRAIEQAAQAGLPPHTLMARAGEAVARLARALVPHARQVWIACGPGNNGGDGLIAATRLQQRARQTRSGPHICVTLMADPTQLPPDAAWAFSQAQAAGVSISAEPPEQADLVIDALLGIGAQRPAQGPIAEHLDAMNRLNAAGALRLSVDLPSGLQADTGEHLHPFLHGVLPAGERHTLSLLTLKPGLFTAAGRDAAGSVWFEALGVDPMAIRQALPPVAWLNTGDGTATTPRPHASHKGSWGDVVVLGGQGISVQGAGMTGAAVLAARAALFGGAGRVYLALLDKTGSRPAMAWDPVCPELMLRTPTALKASCLWRSAAVVCGCGGGEAVASHLPALLREAHTLVLDADALNAIAADGALQALLTARGRLPDRITVLTPHPLEAARLLQTDTASVMRDRLAATQALCDRFEAICVLKGSGSVIGQPGAAPWINHSGNAALATAGTGDVLAGLIGCALASAPAAGSAFERVSSAVHAHGSRADAAMARGAVGLTASELAHWPTRR